MVEPSAKSMKSVKQKIKFYTRRNMNPVPINEIVKYLNALVRGWSNYFHYGYGHRKIKQVKFYMEESLRSQLRYRHKVRNRGASYHKFPRKYLYDYWGLYKPPIVPYWKTVHAWEEEYRKAVCGNSARTVWWGGEDNTLIMLAFLYSIWITTFKIDDWLIKKKRHP